MAAWVLLCLLLMVPRDCSFKFPSRGARVGSRMASTFKDNRGEVFGMMKKSGERRSVFSLLCSGEGPEIYSLEDSEEPESDGDEEFEDIDASEQGDAEGEDSGRFKLKPSKQPMIFNTGSATSTTASSDEILDGSSQRQDGRGVSKAESPLSQAWYKKKQREITLAQKRALREHWGQFGLDLIYGQPLQVRNNTRSVVLDIGFGTGDSIIHMATERVDDGTFFFGIEIHRAGLAQCIAEVANRGLQNVRLIRADATMLLGSYVPKGFFDEIHVYFPDPWPNAFRDGERRVVRSRTVKMFLDALKPGGRVHIATDVEDYARHVENTFAEESSFVLRDSEIYEPGSTLSRLRMRGITRYERRAPDKGNENIYEYVYERGGECEGEE